MSSFYTEEELSAIGFKEYGENVLISRNASIYGAQNITIGSNVRIDDFSILSGRIEIGNYVHIAAGVYLFGSDKGIFLEDYTGVSSRTAIYAVTDDYSGKFMTNPTVPEELKNVVGGPVVLRKHALVATGCTILPNVVIGEGAAIGAMSLVNKSLPPFTMSYGIPVKVVGQRNNNILNLEKQLIKGIKK